MTNYLNEAQDLFEYTRELRRNFHRFPELGFQEIRTAGVVARELNDLGLEVSTGVGKTGVVAMMEGGKPGPVILLRFDMDALPILEETGAEYASQNPGVMHACGHDGHTAVGLTVARLLDAHREDLAGTVKFVFQPAEEGLGGAEAMLADGVLENPRPEVALALHLWNDKPYGPDDLAGDSQDEGEPGLGRGWLEVTSGPVMAAADRFLVRLSGRGGHGASPQLTIDPVLAGGHVITALQSIVARNVNPLQSAVVSVTSMTGGEAFNVIPEKVELKGTIRTFDEGIRWLILKRLEEVVKGVAGGLGCQGEVEILKVTPAVVNNVEITRRVQSVAERLLPDVMIDKDYRTMGSEDMAFMMDEIPGCYFFVGSANAKKGLAATHHHPRFDFDERALPRAAGLMAATAADLLK